ncbi:MAG: DJ-1/PfpI family protein [Thermoplasmata archaeon]
MRRHKEIIDFIKEMNKRGKVIGAICHGPWILASGSELNMDMYGIHT